MTRPILTTRTSFAPAIVDQVERLLEVLGALREDPLFGSAFVLHGGTALNVFHGDLARLSVDIDVMYVGSADLAGMRRERPLIDARLREVTGKLGYATGPVSNEHSGQTYRLGYADGAIKIDVSYLARISLLEPPRALGARARPIPATS